MRREREAEEEINEGREKGREGGGRPHAGKGFLGRQPPKSLKKQKYKLKSNQITNYSTNTRKTTQRDPNSDFVFYEN